ncbi:PEGA domain-containing protein [Pontiellaceae bacterium B1224]|nr:PEGA domain-containing protein [Pontiellaceae bacterium B1224]
MKRSAAAVLLTMLSFAFLTGCNLETPAGKGSITIKSNPDGAAVLVNGTPRGTAPVTISGLVAGDYIIELRKDGFERAYKSVSLLEGQVMDVDLKMKPITGLLLVDSNPQGAEVVIEGISKGDTPLLLTDLPLGEFSLEFRSMKHLPRTLKVNVTDRTPVRAFAELVSNTAQLKVSSDPGEASVSINGIAVGKTPITVEEVEAGEAEVRVSKRGYIPFVSKINFEAQKPYSIEAKLESLPSGLSVLSTPEGAKVLIDRVSVGKTPLNLKDLKIGPHEVTVSLEGYSTKTKTIYLEPDTNDSVEFDMEKNSGTLVIDTEPAGVQVYVDGKLFTTTQPKGGSEAISQPIRITLKSGEDHILQLVREGYVSHTTSIQTEVDQVVTRHLVLKRIFVYDTKITTNDEIIKCRIEYTLPNGNIYYERFPGVFYTAKAENIRKVEPISLDDESNRDARRLIEMNREAVPAE